MHYTIEILLDKTKKIWRFVRGLTFRVQEAMFPTAQSGAIFQRVVRIAKEF